jgi:dTDP-4-dehydrorhamnose reductase
MRFAVLGAGGQLGRDLCPLLPGDVVPLDRSRADLTRFDSLRALFADLRPDVVVNCAAYNFVDRAESEPQEAFAVNAWGVRQLASLCRDHGCTLVHFSTDYVFGLDASRSTPLAETDPPGPVNVYGLSKLAGEYLARATCPRHVVIRTCGLYGLGGSGGKGTNFVETMLRLAGEGKPVRVVDDQTLTPSYSADVARVTVDLLAAGASGLYHLTNAGACTWYQFARAVFDLAGVAAEVTPISSAQFGAPARRPSYSVLAPASIRALGLSPLRPWPDALAAYLEARKARNPPGPSRPA